MTGPLALVCLGGIPWGNSWKRNQSMVYQLAQSSLFDRVLFVNPKEMWMRDELASGQGSLKERTGRVFGSLPSNHGHGLTALTLIRCLPFKSTTKWVCDLENRGFRAYLNQMRRNRPFVLLNNHPNFYWKGLLAGLMRDSVLSVYDLSDDFLEFHQVESHRRIIAKSLEYSCCNSDLVLAVNEHVAERYVAYNENTHVVLNATNTENFQRSVYATVPMLSDLRSKASAVFGYAGIINRVRLDYDLLETTLRARPEWHFVFVGSSDPSFMQLVRGHPNLHYHPTVDYEILPSWLHGFDAVVIPFERNDHTLGNDLLKVNDGLAMGKPVVVAGMTALERYGDLVRGAHDPASFLSALESVLAEDDAGMVERRRAFARENSWQHRASEVRQLLEVHLQRKLREGSSQ